LLAELEEDAKTKILTKLLENHLISKPEDAEAFLKSELHKHFQA